MLLLLTLHAGKYSIDAGFGIWMDIDKQIVQYILLKSGAFAQLCKEQHVVNIQV